MLSYMIQIQVLNFKDKILELESQLLMMTSQDKSALKKQNLSRPLPQKKMLLLLLTERMEVMVSSWLIILLWNSIRLNILPPLVLISNLQRVLLNSNKEKLRNKS
jgi:hypothetical protein